MPALRTDTREPTAELPCPGCTQPVRYYRFSGMGGMAPHFYCDRCSNVYHDPAHRDLVATTTPDAALLARLTAGLPTCPCGGRFTPGMDPKCPHCALPLRHQHDALTRLSDPYAVLLEGALLVQPE